MILLQIDSDKKTAAGSANGRNQAEKIESRRRLEISNGRARKVDDLAGALVDGSGKRKRLQVSTSLAAKPLILAAGSVSDFRVLTVGGDDSVSGTKGLRLPMNVDVGSGNDTVVGSAANDMLFGGEGSDLVRGGKGSDLVFGGGANDLVMGGRGADTLMGEEGDDLIAGKRGQDMLCGGPGADVLRGGRGADTLSGGFSGDWLRGGPGLDRLYADAVDLLLESGEIVQDTGDGCEQRGPSTFPKK